MTPNEISHYESLKKQDTEHRKLIKKLQLNKKELKEKLIIQCVSNRRELLIDLLDKLEKGGSNQFVSKEWIVDNYLQDS
tara:strand:- start:632 stop:868 length:237 start_codon:yes stop_codon:yes gene_type:complete